MRIDARTASLDVCALVRVYFNGEPFSTRFVSLVDSDLGVIQRLQVQEGDEVVQSLDGMVPIETLVGEVRIELPEDLHDQCPGWTGQPKLRYDDTTKHWQVWAGEILVFSGDAALLSVWAAHPARRWLAERIEAPILGGIARQAATLQLAADAIIANGFISPGSFKLDTDAEYLAPSAKGV